LPSEQDSQAMGIQGLLPQLKSITVEKHVADFKGQTVAVDAFCWLHRSAYLCPKELAEGEYATKYVHFCLERTKMLISAGIRVLVVFDGGALPAKANEADERRRVRQENRDRARELMASGNTHAAMECYRKAVNITPEVARRLVLTLRQHRIEYLVAPFEADAQMAYLARAGIVDAVITEDSDLLIYGCPRVLFKLERDGRVQAVETADLPQCRELRLTGFTPDMFRDMCILAGCDFLPSPKGMGIKRAHKFIKECKCFARACKQIRYAGIPMPQGYEAACQVAVWTFQHQRVYCPRRRVIVHLNPMPDGALQVDPEFKKLFHAVAENLGKDMQFLGPEIPDSKVQGIVRGDLHPTTWEPFPEETVPPELRPRSGEASGATPGLSGGQKTLGETLGRVFGASEGRRATASSSTAGLPSGLWPAARDGAEGAFRPPGVARAAGTGGSNPRSESSHGASTAGGVQDPDPFPPNAPRVVSRFFRPPRKAVAAEDAAAEAGEGGPSTSAPNAAQKGPAGEVALAADIGAIYSAGFRPAKLLGSTQEVLSTRPTAAPPVSGDERGQGDEAGNASVADGCGVERGAWGPGRGAGSAAEDEGCPSRANSAPATGGYVGLDLRHVRGASDAARSAIAAAAGEVGAGVSPLDRFRFRGGGAGALSAAQSARMPGLKRPFKPPRPLVPGKENDPPGAARDAAQGTKRPRGSLGEQLREFAFSQP